LLVGSPAELAAVVGEHGIDLRGARRDIMQIDDDVSCLSI